VWDSEVPPNSSDERRLGADFANLHVRPASAGTSSSHGDTERSVSVLSRDGRGRRSTPAEHRTGSRTGTATNQLPAKLHRKDRVMRSYPSNSPQAAARIVALTLLADGDICRFERRALQRTRAAERLGLLPSEFAEILNDCCIDLLSISHSTWVNAAVSIRPRCRRS
jgi:hypothetical protein